MKVTALRIFLAAAALAIAPAARAQFVQLSRCQAASASLVGTRRPCL